MYFISTLAKTAVKIVSPIKTIQVILKVRSIVKIINRLSGKATARLSRTYAKKLHLLRNLQFLKFPGFCEVRCQRQTKSRFPQPHGPREKA